MKKFLLLVGCLMSFVYGNSLDNYYVLIKKYPFLISEVGDYTKGEIQIVLDQKKIQEIEHHQKKQLLKKGYSEDFALNAAKVGIVSEDPYWLLIRDAVIFPSGYLGTYNRLVLKSSLTSKNATGIAVLPQLEDGRVILVLQYRHATRSWEIEIPRGLKEAKETIDEAAIREVVEETGCVIDQLTCLGDVIVDSGLIGSAIPVFFAKVKTIKQSQPESSEAILKNVFLSKKQLEEGLSKGFIELEFNNERKKVSVKDGFLSYAVLQMILQGKW